MAYATCTMGDWDSMGRVITQIRGRAFETLVRAFKLSAELLVFP